MVQIISGQKGKGKTKHLIEKANAATKQKIGELVYLDKNQKHMYELDTKIRLVNVMDYPIQSSRELIGFICGLLSGNHDISDVYLDSFLTLARLEKDDEIIETLDMLEGVSEKFNTNFILSISRNMDELPSEFASNIIVSL